MKRIVLLLIFTCVLAGCSPVSKEEASQIAMGYVADSEVYTDFNGMYLTLVHTVEIEDGYEFIYQFDVEKEGVIGYQFDVPVVNGKIDDPRIFEITEDIAEITNQECSTDDDCKTPFDYLIRSSCPYTSRCINNVCAVVCPEFKGVSGVYDFESCVEAGNDVMESYPRKCQFGERVYIEQIEQQIFDAG